MAENASPKEAARVPPPKLRICAPVRPAPACTTSVAGPNTDKTRVRVNSNLVERKKTKKSIIQLYVSYGHDSAISD